MSRLNILGLWLYHVQALKYDFNVLLIIHFVQNWNYGDVTALTYITRTALYISLFRPEI